MAEDPAAALRLLAERDVDVILSDHKMPGMSGLELLGEVAQRHPATTRLLITGWTADVTSADCASVGIHAVIPKPWDDQELKATLRACFEGG